jgi:serine/threonine-protein kinase
LTPPLRHRTLVFEPEDRKATVKEHHPTPLGAGALFQSRYEVARCLKVGGMGVVYEVLDRRTNRRRALKVMLPSAIADPDLRGRFKLEATITGQVESGHIVETFDADIDAETGSPFLVMELLRGEDLGALLERRGPLPPAEVVILLRQVALALDKTHAAGIVHRDLKPENLYLTHADDGAPRLKILDFGIAKVTQGQGSSAATRVLGTPLYMSPEQIRGEGSISGRGDLYALAHIVYALLVGRAYWREEADRTSHYALVNLMMAGPSEAASTRAARSGVALPPAFDAWFNRATAPDAADRFADAATMVAALGDALGVARALPQERPSLPSGSDPTLKSLGMNASKRTGGTTGALSSDPSPRPLRRSPALAVLGAAGLIGLLGGMVFLGRRLPPNTGGTPAPPAGAPATMAAPPSGTTALAASAAPTLAGPLGPVAARTQLPSTSGLSMATTPSPETPAAPSVTSSLKAPLPRRTGAPASSPSASARPAPIAPPAPSPPAPSAGPVPGLPPPPSMF